MHLYDSGQQCAADAMADGDHCPDHAVGVIVGVEILDDHPMRKLVMRFVAILLLIMFLIPFYFTLRTLYLGASVQEQEGW